MSSLLLFSWLRFCLSLKHVIFFFFLFFFIAVSRKGLVIEAREGLAT